MATRAPGSLPWEVLRDRGELSPMQAIAYWLCEERGLSSAEAAELIGARPGEVRMHLSLARRKRAARA
jgi:DNA-directed RNA polymerase specialized sigma24 family protein